MKGNQRSFACLDRIAPDGLLLLVLMCRFPIGSGSVQMELFLDLRIVANNQYDMQEQRRLDLTCYLLSIIDLKTAALENIHKPI
jgi:hypothetical protein